MQEYMSSGDVALARRNADDTAAMKRSRDEYCVFWPQFVKECRMRLQIKHLSIRGRRIMN
jgi:hypothetical protein